MKFDFAKNLMDKTSFPDEAKVYFTELADRVKAGFEEEFDSFIAHYVKHIDTDVIREKLHSFADKTGENYYSCWMLLLLIASEEAKKKYEEHYGPLTAVESLDCDRWAWADTPLPWEGVR